MNKLKFVSVFVSCFLFPVILLSREYNICDYGAIPNGKTLNTAIIQKVIDLASKNGGGKIVIPKGTFLTGGLELKSNVHLYLVKGSILLGSTNANHYKKLYTPNRPYTEKQDDNAQMALIMAYKANNVSVTGRGMIDERGREMVLNIMDSLFHIRKINYKRLKETFRPKLFYISSCNNFLLTGVTVKNSPGWGLSFELCHGLKIDGIKEYNRAYWNNDGIDVDDCTNVHITNCSITSGDDAICLKSYYTQFADDSIFISNCILKTTGNAIKFGSASYGGFRNILIKNIKICEAFHSAIAIQSVDGCQINNIIIDNVRATNVGNALFIRLGRRAGIVPGSIHDVSIRNMKAEISFTRTAIDYSKSLVPSHTLHDVFPISIVGIPGCQVGGIQIKNISITFPGKLSSQTAYNPINLISKIPERISEYPEDNMFGELPVWGFYVRHAKDITFKHIRLKLINHDFRPSAVFDDVKNINIHRLLLPLKNNKIFIRNNSQINYGNNIKMNITEIN
jgi:hypothetical protein